MNKVIIKGRISQDLDVKYTSTDNMQVTRVSVAVNRQYVKQGEERQVDFFNCVAFGKTAEFLSKYFAKGQEIIIIGRLQNRSWTDDKGQKKYATDIIVEEADFCGSKKDNDNSTPKKENTKPNVDMGFSAEDDDLPF